MARSWLPPSIGSPLALSPQSRTRASVALAGPSPPQAALRELGRLALAIWSAFPSSSSSTAPPPPALDARVEAWPVRSSTNLALQWPLRQATHTPPATAPASLLSLPPSHRVVLPATRALATSSLAPARAPCSLQSSSSRCLLPSRPISPPSRVTRVVSCHLAVAPTLITVC